MAARPESWLRSAYGWTGYAVGWLTFGVGFAAAFWLGRPNLARAAQAASVVVLPVALLGLAAVWICNRLPIYERRRPWLPIVHAVLALAFAGCWIAAVWLVNQSLGSLGGQPVRFSLPQAHIVHWHLLAGSLQYAVLASVTVGYRHAMASERERRAAELRLLQAQLNPHFIFNALHSIFALTREDAVAGERALAAFTQLLRYVLQVHRDGLDFVTLEEEWAFSRLYLEIERMRLAERLTITADVDDDALDCLTPPLLLQPLVENAVQHGIAPLAAGGHLRIAIRRDGRHIAVRVEDTGAGARGDVWTSRGIGLRSIRTRLESIYPGDATCTVDQGRSAGFGITVRFPAVDAPAPRAAWEARDA